MKLKSIKYVQFENTPKEWNLDLLELDSLNLIVGKNATGKTKTLTVIHNFARLLCGELKPVFASAKFDAIFEHENKTYRYMVEIVNKEVVEEKFKNDAKVFFERDKKGAGKIWAEEERKMMDFQTPTTELAITVRRDAIQHPYITPLYEWGKLVYFYAFGSPLGRDTFTVIQNENAPIEADVKNPAMVVSIFKKGEETLGNGFKKAIIQDMKNIGYNISDIGTEITSVFPKLLGLWVKENDLNSKTEQPEMSQGMFRALSLIIQLNYSKLAHKPSCILIDDIGEGLDFDRSYTLIELLMKKIEGSNIQLVMATNDRFVMNKVPLEMWTVLERDASHCRVFNIKNSKEKFEEFKFTGLNNFDFFATDYLTEDKQ